MVRFGKVLKRFEKVFKRLVRFRKVSKRLTFNFPLSPPKSLHPNYAHAPFKTCPYQPLNQTKTRAVTGVFTPQRCANVCCCNLQLFLLLCKPFLQQQTFAQQQPQVAGVCNSSGTVYVTLLCHTRINVSVHQKKAQRSQKRSLKAVRLAPRCSARSLEAARSSIARVVSRSWPGVAPLAIEGRSAPGGFSASEPRPAASSVSSIQVLDLMTVRATSETPLT